VRTIVGAFTLLLSIVAGREVGAQTLSCEGRAFGSFFDNTGDEGLDDELSQADTGACTGTATAGDPSSRTEMSCQAQGEVADACPVAAVLTADSSVLGRCHGDLEGATNETFVDSHAGASTAQLGCSSATPPAFEIVSGGSDADVDCDGFLCDSAAVTLQGGGSNIPLSGEPNTEATVPGLGRIISNQQFRSETAGPTAETITKSCLVNAVHGFTTSGMEFVLSSSFAEADFPRRCSDCVVLNATKSAAIVTDGGTPGAADAGDRLRFTVRVQNSGLVPAGTLVIADRVPLRTTLDPASIQLDGTACASCTVASCRADQDFTQCPDEPASDNSRQCVNTLGANLDPGQTRVLVFDVVVDECGTGAICNDAQITAEHPPDCPNVEAPVDLQRVAIVTCPKPNPTPTPTPGGDILKTAGSGGCSIGGGGGVLDLWPLVVVGLLFSIRALGLRRRVRGGPVR
jgi:uncharacterized repeat protein (TIGR01451 family)